MLGFSTESWFFFTLSTALAAAMFLAGLKYGRAKGPILGFYATGAIVIDRNSAKSVPDVVVAYKGNECPRLSVSRLWFWNAGDAVVDHAMLVTADPIRVVANDGQILECAIEDESEKLKRRISVTVVDGSSELRIAFDYLNVGEGFVLRVLHTSAEPTLSAHGSLKGARLRHVKDVEPLVGLGSMVALFFGLLVFCVVALRQLFSLIPEGTLRQYPALAAGILVVVSVVCVFSIGPLLNYIFKTPIPKHLKPPQ